MENNIKKIENYDKGMIFVIGYLCYGGYVNSLDISKWFRTYKVFTKLYNSFCVNINL